MTVCLNSIAFAGVWFREVVMRLNSWLRGLFAISALRLSVLACVKQ